MGAADYTIVVGYFCLLLGLGLWFRRRASASMEDYFLAGRKMPWWALGISGMASYVDMAGTMLIVSFLYMLGPRGLYIEFRGGAVLVLTFMLLWSGKWHYRSRCMTGAEWMEYRFGTGFGGRTARLLAAVAVIVSTVGMLAYMMKALGLFAAMFIPLSPGLCTLLIVALATLYTIASGFYGVVYTDLLQSTIVVAAVFMISIIAAVQVAGIGDPAALASRVTGDPNWGSSILPWHASMPKGYEQYSSMMLFAFFYLLRNALIGMSSAGADPKYFGARNERECGTLSFLWMTLMMFRWPMMIGFALLGIMLAGSLFPQPEVLAQAAAMIKEAVPGISPDRWADIIVGLRSTPELFPPALLQGLQGLLHDDWQSKISLLSFQGTVNPESIVPAVIFFYLPVGLRGFLVVAFLAAALSVFNSTVNATSAYFTRDIFQRYLKPEAGRRELLAMTSLFAVVLVATGFVFAYHLHSINQIWGWVMMALGGGIAIPSMLKFYWWRLNGWGFASGTGAGIIGAVALAWVSPGWHEWQMFLCLGGLSLAATLAGTYLTEPTPDATVTHFYGTTRPFGFWRPYKHRLSAPVRLAMEREHRNDLAAVPFTLGWQITLFLLPMQLMIHAWADLPLTLAFFAVCSAGMYWFWYRQLPPGQRVSARREPHHIPVPEIPTTIYSTDPLTDRGDSRA